MPTAAFAGKVQRIDFTVTEPVIGETPDTAINVKFTPNYSTSEGIDVSWRKNSTTNDPNEPGWVMMNTGEKFEAGFYYLVFYGIPNDWTPSTSFEVYVNGKEVTDSSVVEDVVAIQVFDNLFGEVTNIDVTVDAPVIGEKPDFKPQFTSTPADSVSWKPESMFWRECSKESYESYENGEIEKINWQTIHEEDVFKKDCYYRVEVPFDTVGKYFFTANTKTTVNGRSNDYDVPILSEDLTAACASATFAPLTPGPVTEIHVEVDTPLVGKTPDFDPEYDATIDGSGWQNDVIKLENDSVKWYESKDENGPWDVMDEDDEFKEGYYYRFDTAFEPKTPYSFTEDTTAYVNFNDCQLTLSSDNSTAYVSATFGPLAPIPVTNILVTVVDPCIGDSPNFTPVGYGAAINDSKQYDEVNILKLKDGKVKWYESDEENGQWDVMDENDKFEEGYYYRIDAEFETNTGYCFTTDTKAKVNGYRHNGDRPVYGEDSTCAYVSRTLGPLSDKIIEVTSIAAEVDTPVIGKTPDYEPRVTSDPADSVEVYDVKWYKTDNENPSNGDILGNPGVELGKDEKFEEGYCYIIMTTFRTKYGYCLDTQIKPTINGMEVIPGAFGEYEIPTFVAFKPEKPVNVDEPITSIAAKVDAPVIGNTPDFSPEITSAPDGSAEPFKAIWYKIPEDKYTGTADDGWELVAQDEAFKEGCYYSVLVGAVENDGFCFTNDTTATLNGKAHVETLGPVYSDEYVDNVARIYGVFEPLHSQSSSSGGGNSSIHYKLTFDTNGGSSISGITKSRGTNINLEEYKAEKDGFAFTGWYSDRELTDKITSIKLTSNTTVYAGWKAIEEDPVTDEFPFADVDTDDWFFEDVAYAYENGLMSGTSADTFSPETATTRGMIVTILYRLEGEPEISGSCAFDDVKSGSYYENAITWAAANGIVSGYDNGLFGPDDAITREQLATILYRYAQYKGFDVSVGEDTNILSYNDALDISEYAVPAMQWLCGEGIMSGSDGNLMPMGNATRAQVAAFLHRFCENIL
ncbi:S-layer homology domain-containing protein [Anaerotignum sp.]